MATIQVEAVAANGVTLMGERRVTISWAELRTAAGPRNAEDLRPHYAEALETARSMALRTIGGPVIEHTGRGRVRGATDTYVWYESAINLDCGATHLPSEPRGIAWIEHDVRTLDPDEVVHLRESLQATEQTRCELADASREVRS